MNIACNAKSNTAFNVTKTTRAGYTTNAILAPLEAKKSILLVEPTNAIAYETVKKAYDIHGDSTKTIKAIPSNVRGCSKICAKLAKNESLESMPFHLSEDCIKCDVKAFSTYPEDQKSTEKNCIIKNLIQEYKSGFKPDIVTITYDKLQVLANAKKGKRGSKNNVFREMIDNVDIVLFDEFGEYLFKNDVVCNIRHEMQYAEKIEIETIQSRISHLDDLIKKKYHNHYKFFEYINDGYVQPFLKQLDCDFGDLPHPIHNVLFTEKIDIYKEKEKLYGTKNNKDESFYMSKAGYLKTLSVAMNDNLEYMILDNKKNVDIVNYFLSLLQIMSDENIIGYSSSTIKHDKDGDGKHIQRKISETNITRDRSTLISDIEKWIKSHQATLFTDATMPAFKFSKFSKNVENIYFGDPAGTNDKTLIVHGQEQNFSNTKWYKNRDYQTEIIESINKLINQFGSEKIVIWAPNKSIHTQILKLLRKRNINVSSHWEINNSTDAIITYYNSTLTRGVESDRRIQILVGKANKPIGSFRHIAYMQLDNYEYIGIRELNDIALNEEIALDEFTYLVDDFCKGMKHYAGRDVYRFKKTMKEQLITYFEKCSDAIQQSKTYADTWQAASRAKDPKGVEPSIIYCVGWKNTEIIEMAQWGVNLQYRQPLMYNLKILNQNTSIPSPKIINYDLDSMIDWIEGKKINDNFDVGKDIVLALISQLLNNFEFDNKYFWRNFQHGDADFKNGYLVGATRALKNGNYQFEIIETSPGMFKYSLDGVELKLYPHCDLIIKVLRAAYESKKDNVTYKEIRAKLSSNVPDADIKEAMELIKSDYLLYGSTWQIEYVSRSLTPIIKKPPSMNNI